MEIKKQLKQIIRWLIARPLVVGILIIGLIVVGYLSMSSITSWWFERGVEQHIEQREDKERIVNELEGEAASSAGAGEENLQQAKESTRRADELRKQVKEKKDNATQLQDKADNAGRDNIGDSDLPSNFELCTRANDLGVRCDFDQ